LIAAPLPHGNAATTLRQAGDLPSARRIMEFIYTRQLDREELARPVFLGLAEIRVQQGNVPAALELLHRLTLVVGEPFENLAASGALLERLNRPAEALEFRRPACSRCGTPTRSRARSTESPPLRIAPTRSIVSDKWLTR
jgi:hypothetical protein